MRAYRVSPHGNYVVIDGQHQWAVDTISVKCSCNGAPLCEHYQTVSAIEEARQIVRRAKAKVAA